MKKKVVKKKQDVSKQPPLAINMIHPFDSDGYFFSNVDESVRKLYPSLPPSPTKMDIDIKSENSAPSESIAPSENTFHICSCSNPRSYTRFHYTTHAKRRLCPHPFHIAKSVLHPRPAHTTTNIARSQSSHSPSLVITKGPSPVSYVKFLDVPYLTRERYLETLKENTKWSTAKVSCIETFGMKTKDGNWNIKVGFKDNAQSTIVKKLLTMNITFGSDTRRC
ncbi:hypothetical protein M378DRAFT_17111 [Amanita muscaria Koide BX008]|uniref:Uncharacterized protein n=1 Tax=Amanita muscaria (strain Koide BX008) TaxID=946122 RepID=A0A0C2SQY2_AMAMK|nr:hypothetical protein M378DRAFT_17111 [Amanita muscaria Koide BX008]